MQRTRAFTLIEILVVLTIIATLAGMISALVISARQKSNRTECLHNVRQLVGMLETTGASRYPKLAGPALILSLVQRGEIQGRDQLDLLFCPGDPHESLRDAGGEAAYEGLRAETGGLAHLTSYAARAMTDPACIVSKSPSRSVVLIADDSEDHHDGKGIVVGLTGGVAKFRDKVDDYGLARDTPLAVGSESDREELRCLRAD